MTPQIQWRKDDSLLLTPCKAECEYAAWLFHEWGNQPRDLFYVTLRDMMLHGY